MFKSDVAKRIAAFFGDSLTLTDFYEVETEVADVPTYSLGLSATLPNGLAVAGAASGFAKNRERTEARAKFELLERATIRMAIADHASLYKVFDQNRNLIATRTAAEIWPELTGERWKYATSNGVALGREWGNATKAALEEILERDALQRAWFLGEKPERLPTSAPLLHGLETYRVGENMLMAVRRNRDSGRFDMGFSFLCGSNLARAKEKATEELLQRTVFCEDWDSEESPPTTAGTEYNMWMTLQPAWGALFARWLAEGLSPDFELVNSVVDDLPENVKPEFIDLTEFCPKPGFQVVKAHAAGAIPLCFGWDHPALAVHRQVAAERCVHPCF